MPHMLGFISFGELLFALASFSVRKSWPWCETSGRPETRSRSGPGRRPETPIAESTDRRKEEPENPALQRAVSSASGGAAPAYQRATGGNSELFCSPCSSTRDFPVGIFVMLLNITRERLHIVVNQRILEAAVHRLRLRRVRGLPCLPSKRPDLEGGTRNGLCRGEKGQASKSSHHHGAEPGRESTCEEKCNTRSKSGFPNCCGEFPPRAPASTLRRHRPAKSSQTREADVSIAH